MKKWWVGLGALAALSTLIGLYYNRVPADFWPLDNSRIGPNIVASVITYLALTVVAALIYPPTRKWVERKFGDVHRRIDDLEESHELTHQMMQHVIDNHPDIPEFKKRESAK